MRTAPLPLAVPAGARCIACGYALEALCEPRCPECGRGFDPNRVSTMRVPGAVGLGQAAARSTSRVLNGTTYLTLLILVLSWAAVLHPFPLLLALLALLMAGVIGRRTAVVLGLLLSPPSVLFVAGAVSYVAGVATLRGTSSELGSLDPDLRCDARWGHGRRIGSEFMTVAPHDFAITLLTRLFGPQRGAYTGPYPTEAEARAALRDAAPVKVADVATDAVPVAGGGVVKLSPGVGAALLNNRHLGLYSPASGVWLPAELEQLTGGITGALWRDRCLILRIPNEPKVGFRGAEQDACVVVIDSLTGRPFAYYAEGNYAHYFPPVRWKP